MNNFEKILKQFLHDPPDKCFDIRTHEQRAKIYAEMLGVAGLDDAKGPDQIASCAERSFLPKPEKYNLKKEDLYEEFNEIRHPISEAKLDVPKFSKDDIFKKMDDIFKNLKGLQSDDKLKFLYLWRNLSEIIFKNFKNDPQLKDIARYLPVLPADTRIPDHSIWEHIKITSAVNAFEQYQNNSLFLFTIGPVQSFISQARKTQDLFMGSFLLSYLVFIAIEKVIEDYGPASIIYPDLPSQPFMDWYLEHKENIVIKNSFVKFVCNPTIPNRFVAIIPETEQDKIEKLAKKLEDAVKNEWKIIVQKVLESFRIKIREDEVIERQTSDFPQIYWVAVPWKKDKEDIKLNDLTDFIEKSEIERWEKIWEFAKDKGEFQPNIGLLYQLLYTSLEKSLGARKNLRNFEQLEEQKKKCSICGEKEAIIQSEIGNLKIGKFISKVEKLCVPCFTKRGAEKYFYEKFGEPFKDFSFPSTAEVASSDFKEKAIREAKEEFKNYIEKFKHLTRDKFPEVQPLPRLKESFKDIENLEGEWFYEDNLTERSFEKNLGVNLDKEKIGELKENLRKIGKPNTYYAIVMLDADDMGKWLSGEKLPSIEYAYNSNTWKNLPDNFKNELKTLSPQKILTPAIHASISNALKNYSLEFVRKIVEEEHLGKLVYAGGDDVLAFVNLKDLFEVMIKLRAAFSGYIKIKDDGGIDVDWQYNTGFVEKDGKYLLTMGPKASASCGVVIAHYKMPLKLVLDKVREMKKEAKNITDKDAFAIALIKHSGQIKEFTCKWRFDKDNKKIDTIEKMREIGDFFTGKDSVKLSKTFIQKIHNEFVRLKDKKGIFSGTGDIFNTELKRLLKRSLEGGEKEERKKEVKTLVEILSSLFWHSEIGGNIDRFANLLETISYIKGGGIKCF